tara:strand:- start:1570 stop:2271 length:702 start_codon:yes stop_codon:yes gene_type:complete
MTAKLKQRIGLLGGSFDPVHLGHLGLANDVLRIFELEQVLLIPANISPHKQDNERANSDHRLKMLKLAIEGEKSLAISTIELERGGVSYTIDTLTTLQLHHPEIDFTLILGMDVLKDLENWKNWKEILERCNIAVAVRPGVAVLPLGKMLDRLFPNSNPYRETALKNCQEAYFRNDLQRNFKVFRSRSREISASEIKRILSGNRAVKNLLPPKVEKYIIANNLYITGNRPHRE